VSVSRTTFNRNDVAIMMEDGECVSLNKVTFEDNGADVVGATCGAAG